MVKLTPIQNQWLKKVIENPECFKEVPLEIRTESFLHQVLMEDPFLIGEIENPSFELQLFAVQQPVYFYSDSALFNLNNPSEYLKFQTVKHSPLLITDLEDVSTRIRLEALKQEPTYFAFCDFQNEEEVIVGLCQKEELWDHVDFSLFKSVLIESALATLLCSGAVVEFREQTISKLIHELVRVQQKIKHLRFDFDHFQDRIDQITKNPLVLSHIENRFKTYRLSRYAIRLNKTNRWFSPYHVLESYEDYLLMPECERVI